MQIPLRVGFPIRISTDQSLFAAPRGFSQRTTSFIASRRQGIHQMPLRRLTRMTILTTHNGNHPHRHRSIFPTGIASTYDNQNLPCTSRRTRVSNSCRALFRLLTSRDECHAAITNPLHSVKKPAARNKPNRGANSYNLTIEIKQNPTQKWWAWEDLNFRPHAYQARALTN